MLHRQSPLPLHNGPPCTHRPIDNSNVCIHAPLAVYSRSSVYCNRNVRPSTRDHTDTRRTRMFRARCRAPRPIWPVDIQFVSTRSICRSSPVMQMCAKCVRRVHVPSDPGTCTRHNCTIRVRCTLAHCRHYTCGIFVTRTIDSNIHFTRIIILARLARRTRTRDTLISVIAHARAARERAVAGATR